MEDESRDEPWGGWAEAWQRDAAPGEVTEDVERRVRWETRRQKMYVVFEALVALGLLGYSAFRMWETPDTGTIVWAVAIWVFTLTAWAFSFWNRQGTWAPAEQTVRSFLETSRRRSRRDARAVRFGVGLIAAEVAFVVAWYAWRLTGAGSRELAWETLAAAAALLLVVTAALVGWLLHLRRRADERLRWIREREAELAGERGPAAGRPGPGAGDVR